MHFNPYLVGTIQDYKSRTKLGIQIGFGSHLQRNSWTELCQESPRINIIKIPASPQEELPILRTHEGWSEGRIAESLDVDEQDDDVLMAIISPKRTSGTTNPELQLVS